ncbi:MAG: AhpC/TSA family protein [Pseudomonadota bacterium]|nr:AhpC/TSA family protein [Pseudomonadota bacterium]
MNPSEKLSAGSTFPDLSFPRVGGGRVSPSQGSGWRMLVVYRGRHCPLCRKYLAALENLLGAYTDAGVEVMAVSTDSVEKAEPDVAEQGWTFPVGYGMEMEQMKALGLYVSSPRSPEETDRPFAEPGTFVINPDGALHIVDISNAPFSRPDLQGLLNGLKFIQENDYPIRGTLA